jgi:uncharacterized protein YdaL
MTFLKRSYLILASCMALHSVPSFGTGVWQASIRERFVSPQQFPYGGDSALRIRRNTQDLGFTAFTMTTRLQMLSKTSSNVFSAPVRSRRADLETMISSIVQGKGEVVFKPLISLKGTLGVADRLTDINPENTATWFTSYEQAVNFISALSLKREIHEIVMGTGLHHLWKAELADRWIDLAKEIHRRSGDKTRVSIELSSDADVVAFETWKAKDPSSFARLSDELDVVRYSARPVESSNGAGDWSVRKTADAIQARHVRVAALFPSQRLQIANVTVPGCRVYTLDEDEVLCAPNSKFDKAYQASGFNAFLGALNFLPETTRNQIDRIDILMATTDFEPKIWDFDSRFPYYNDLGKKVLSEKLQQDWQSAAPATTRSGAHRGPSSVVETAKKKACIYYDNKDSKDKYGPIHARMMENLMGAFPAWSAQRRKSTEFKPGDTADCEAVFYIATNYDIPVSAGFYDELVQFSTRKTLVWMNYRLDKFEKAYNAWADSVRKPQLTFTVTGIEQAQMTPSSSLSDPGFYRYFEYKGETFEKLSKWDYRSNRFMSSTELAVVKILDPGRVKILSKALHSTKNTRTPYVVKQMQSQGSIWYFADSPMSYVHYEDRYLILCDLMWDILQEKAPDGPLGALIRLEDVNPSQNSFDLRWAMDYLGSEKVPFSLAVIPYYANSFGTEFSDRRPVVLPITEYKEFIGSLKYGIAQGANIVWHGVYHHAGDHLSGFDGTSGPDYEFWLYPEDTPIPEDSTDFVLDQLEKGEAVFKKLGVRPVAWEVPHYASSALDSVMFGKLFAWNYHRSLYFWSEVTHDAPLTAKHRMMDCVTPECRQERRELARQLTIKEESLDFAGQPVPFRVWKDSYGQALIPETLGMIDYVFYEDNTWRPVSNEQDLLRRAKKLRVIRGSFASFFWHPDIANPKLPYYERHPGHYESIGGKNSLKTLIRGLKALGYEFKSISDCSLFPQENCKQN